MIPLNGWVLAAAALVSSPALWSSMVEGTMPLDVAITRFLVAAAACWVAMSAASELVWPSRVPQRVTNDDAGGQQSGGTTDRATDRDAERSAAADTP
ncbi:hypothetical protein ACFP3Q_13660 [Nocardioides sp. GCM10027113]|uniref:hypothetical protein n=1 Tax=unclassified Nocardioides TaxID=2615069 RepID=UPI0036075A8E